MSIIALLIRTLLLAITPFCFYKVIRSKTIVDRITWAVLGVALAVPQYFLYQGDVFCEYRSSDGQFDTHVPKTDSYETTMKRFEEYRLSHRPDNTLCRTCTRGILNWLNYFSWPDPFVHPRWKLPICEGGLGQMPAPVEPLSTPRSK